MKKFKELSDPTSCLNKAESKEMLFVLLARDRCAPDTIRFWVAERLRRGLNTPTDPQIKEALDCALIMENGV